MHAFLPLGDSVRLGMRETWLSCLRWGVPRGGACSMDHGPWGEARETAAILL